MSKNGSEIQKYLQSPGLRAVLFLTVPIIVILIIIVFVVILQPGRIEEPRLVIDNIEEVLPDVPSETVRLIEEKLYMQVLESGVDMVPEDGAIIRENSWDGFKWVEANDNNGNVYIYKRFNKKGQELLVFLNFSGRDMMEYYVKTSNKARYKEIFNSDDMIFGGSGITNEIQKSTKGYIKLNCAKFSIVIMKKI